MKGHVLWFILYFALAGGLYVALTDLMKIDDEGISLFVVIAITIVAAAWAADQLERAYRRTGQ